jgi:uncharacterized protein
LPDAAGGWLVSATFITTMLEAAPYVVLGFLIAGIIKFWVPENFLQRHLSGAGRRSLIKSAGIGAFLPLCSCGTVPIGMGLHRCGVRKGNILAFMTSAPVLSPVLIMLAYRLLGWKLTATLLFFALGGAYLIGLFGNRLLGDAKVSDCATAELREFHPREREHSSLPGRCLETIRWSFCELGADVGVDIAIGLGLATLILSFLPMEWISSWLGAQEISTLLYVIALGIPVYACSIPSVPVVQGLLLLGASPGAAVAYLIAGPATNLGELNAIRKEMGLRSALYYAAALVILALLTGVFADQFVFRDYSYYAYREEGRLVVQQCCIPLIFGDTVGVSSAQAAVPAWHWPFGILLAATIIHGVIKRAANFLMNPCRSCTWNEYGYNGSCGAKCHVRRKYECCRAMMIGRSRKKIET